MKIQRFEDIDAWKESRLLTNIVYKASRNNKEFYNDLRFRGQITAASVSAMSNIAEGFGDQSNKEFIKFLRYSRRSCSEVQSQLYVALDQEYISQKKFDEIYTQARKVKELIGGFIRYLRKSGR